MCAGVPARDSPEVTMVTAPGVVRVPLQTGADSGSVPAEGATSTPLEPEVCRRCAAEVMTGRARRLRGGPMFTTGVPTRRPRRTTPTASTAAATRAPRPLSATPAARRRPLPGGGRHRRRLRVTAAATNMEAEEAEGVEGNTAAAATVETIQGNLITHQSFARETCQVCAR